MAFEIAKQATTYFPKKKATKNAGFLSFTRKLPSVVSGQYGCEACHISTANPYWMHYGRAKGSKAQDRWVLSLTPEEHRWQHSRAEMDYWMSVNINPHELALIIYGAYSEMGDDALEWATAKIMSGVEENARRTDKIASDVEKDLRYLSY